MKVVLTEDVKGLGIAGDIVNVKPGYGRNFLIKENKAVEGTAANIKRAEQIRIDKVKEAADNKRSAEVLAKLLDETTITIREKAGEDGKLFGSVTSKDIAEALKEQKDITIDKRKILLDAPFRHVGRAEVRIKTFQGVEGELTGGIKAA